jgi:CelD/BcsL family acetyltransferase involved in cellulose biosynthesis
VAQPAARAFEGRPSLEVVDDEMRLSALADDWRALLDATPERSAFHSLAWIAACRAALPSNGRLSVLVVRDGAKVAGILPTTLGPHGDLRFVGQGPLSNYLGPVYRAPYAEVVVDALRDFLTRERRVSLLDFAGLRAHSPFVAALARLSMTGWSRPHVVATATCPFVDLTPGWDALRGRHGGKQRANFARKAARLARLGAVEFQEIVEPADVCAALPAMMDLYRRRWAGRHESGGFAGRHRDFHAHAAPALAAAGHARASLLRVDGRIVAFSYGLRAGGVTTSYVLAHDDAFGAHSPGLLLLLRLLEAACRRGDREYDLSVGEEAYKDAWASGRRQVVRVLCWRRASPAAIRGRMRAFGVRAWVRARSIDLLRDLRREGLGHVIGRARARRT